jgi:ATP-dependent DNA helicase RecQ
MKLLLKTFSLLPCTETGAFDSSAVEAFLEDKALVEVRDYMQVSADRSVWHLLVLYRPLQDASVYEASDGRRGSRRPPDLSTEHRETYEALRKWRNDKADAKGVSAFTLFSNAQLAAIAASRPRTLEALLHLRGIGHMKVKHHGEEVLALIERLSGPLAENVAPASEGKPSAARSQSGASQPLSGEGGGSDEHT